MDLYELPFLSTSEIASKENKIPLEAVASAF
jgi:hypothetical protein